MSAIVPHALEYLAVEPGVCAFFNLFEYFSCCSGSEKLFFFQLLSIFDFHNELGGFSGNHEELTDLQPVEEVTPN